MREPPSIFFWTVTVQVSLLVLRIFSRILQSTYGGLGVVKCLDLMEQKSDAREPMKADSQFLAPGLNLWKKDFRLVATDVMNHKGLILET